MRKLKAEQPYIMINNVPIQDNTLSMKAKGLLTYMLSKPDSYDFSIESLSHAFADGKRAISTTIQELEEHGYLIRQEQSRSDAGTFSSSDYIICEEPDFFIEKGPNGTIKKYRNNHPKQISEDVIKALIIESDGSECGMGNEEVEQLAINILKGIGIDVLPQQEIEKQMQMELKKDDKEESLMACIPAKRPGRKKKEKAPKERYGEFDNVLLTIEEYNKLCERFPDDYQRRIEALSSYMSSKGKTYKDHYATIITWANMEKKRQEKQREQNRLDWLDAM